ncbi:MAG: hypothetical protein A2741_01470 [Candidatus Zambryskibacteria bacterium RIFCSPHIGHO2_01_FULL_43_27]|uniref:Uncharacterized protein n=1 Tax=Candidatus Zambryskibacteria bacterium RIFCSPLOWO2_01_FULL_43_17 TaxID=1802760 RepID=A0A1G2U392_9BACT|nr:MAG: hypothetical protein A2741_01470 [Candidatus Zambryskibacteria bacterium RIFCSPHIGHO2_01_FULL_43_27]OHA99447.1 MAG: hypothetical protein A3E93_02580 [Candidatus Zambryskibacteria bacterium RIFCSPHIGHO2_12_FULL_43_12b]OHB03282.1 MAG: hypothetical protein A2920_00200 [Candidatus Zambryskibacteria bacterium RIFCSPLOWO2_01_FULL_43_17]
MKHFFKYISAIILTAIFLVSPISVFAVHQGGAPHPPGGGGGGAPNPSYTITIDNPLKTGTGTLQDFIKLVIQDVVIPVGGVIAVIFIVYAGFMYVTAQGSEEKIKTAHRALLYAVIGTAILLGAWVISEGIAGTINQLTTP